MRCPTCQHENAAAAKFCVKCGTRLPNSARCDDQRVQVRLYHQGTGARESKLILVLGEVAPEWVAGRGVGEIRRTTPQVDVRTNSRALRVLTHPKKGAEAHGATAA